VIHPHCRCWNSSGRKARERKCLKTSALTRARHFHSESHLAGSLTPSAQAPSPTSTCATISGPHCGRPWRDHPTSTPEWYFCRHQAQCAHNLSSSYPTLALPQFFTRDRADVIANNCSPHCIHYLSADQIGHHMVFETHQGKTRVFQCSVKARVTTTYCTEHYVG
jgi:hypothetical protein